MELQGKDGEIKIYTTPWCPFCHRAIALLNSKGVTFEQINVDGRADVRQALTKLTGSRTVPQIFINGNSVEFRSKTAQLLNLFFDKLSDLMQVNMTGNKLGE